MSSFTPHEYPETGRPGGLDGDMRGGLSHSRPQSNPFLEYPQHQLTRSPYGQSPDYPLTRRSAGVPVPQATTVTQQQQQQAEWRGQSGRSHAPTRLQVPNQAPLAARSAPGSASRSTISISNVGSQQAALAAYFPRIEDNILHDDQAAPYQHTQASPWGHSFISQAFGARFDVGLSPPSSMAGPPPELLDNTMWSLDAGVWLPTEQLQSPGNQNRVAGPSLVHRAPAPVQPGVTNALPAQGGPVTQGRPRQVRATRNTDGCLCCRLRRKRCPVINDVTPRGPDGRCSECNTLNIQCLQRYGEPYPKSWTDLSWKQECKDAIKKFTGHRPNRNGPTLRLERYCHPRASLSMTNTQSPPPRPRPTSRYQIPPPVVVIEPPPQMGAPSVHQQRVAPATYNTLLVPRSPFPSTPSSHGSSLPPSPTASSTTLSDYPELADNEYWSDPNYSPAPAVSDPPIEGLSLSDPPEVARANSPSIEGRTRSETNEALDQYSGNAGSSSRAPDTHTPHGGLGGYHQY